MYTLRNLLAVALSATVSLACLAAEPGETFRYKTDEGTGKYTVISESDHTVELTSFGVAKLDVELPAIVKDKEGTEYEVVAVSAKAFDGSPVSSITFPATVTEIGDYIFSNTTSLKSVVLPAGLKEVPYGMFARSRIESVAMPDGLTKIGGDAFLCCHRLTEVSIPESVTEIGIGAFDSCPLQHIKLPSALISLGRNAFLNCWMLEEIVLPGEVREIGKNAFSGCTSLKSVTMEEGVETIGANAFKDCNMLTSIVLPSTLKEVGIYGLYATGLRSVYVKAMTPPACIEEYEVTGEPVLAPIFTLQVMGVATLYVPEGTKNLYMDDECWRFSETVETDFRDVIGVAGVPAASEEDSAIYDILGRRVTAPEPGHIYIRDGRKILWK